MEQCLLWRQGGINMNQTRIFIFEDSIILAEDGYRVNKLDINEELECLENDGWSIKSVQHTIFRDFYKHYCRWDKNIFTVVVEKERKDFK